MTETYWVIKRLSDGFRIADTLRRTRREAIDEYDGWYGVYHLDRRRGEVKAVKVRLVEVGDG